MGYFTRLNIYTRIAEGEKQTLTPIRQDVYKW